MQIRVRDYYEEEGGGRGGCESRHLISANLRKGPGVSLDVKEHLRSRTSTVCNRHGYLFMTEGIYRSGGVIWNFRAYPLDKKVYER
ncbi:hypothetical protein L596_012381 [Steinernema carpocapsae]|uniref:Uncharacterized protein n=1 Tax=Steinernema carpocapsae TaxID=34508 RepID=A0A4U5NX48_STECR|nr:hypothetical protein L596_012381 [Steinernema carpocapsae]